MKLKKGDKVKTVIKSTEVMLPMEESPPGFFTILSQRAGLSVLRH
jgi:hypothetical protein